MATFVTSLDAQIATDEQRQDDLDSRIAALDARIAAAANLQNRDAEPGRRALNASIGSLHREIGDLLYDLGQVTARLEIARGLASRADKSPVTKPGASGKLLN